MTNEELTVRARAVVQGFKGDEFWIFQDAAAVDVAAFARSMINTVLEDVAVELKKLEEGVYTSAQTPAGLVRAMKVK